MINEYYNFPSLKFRYINSNPPPPPSQQPVSNNRQTSLCISIPTLTKKGKNLMPAYGKKRYLSSPRADGPIWVAVSYWSSGGGGPGAWRRDARRGSAPA